MSSTLKLGKKSPKKSEADQLLDSMDNTQKQEEKVVEDPKKGKEEKKEVEKSPKKTKKDEKKESKKNTKVEKKEEKSPKKKSPRKNQKDKLKDVVVEMFKATLLASSGEEDADVDTLWEKMEEHFNEVWDKDSTKLTKSVKGATKTKKKKDKNAPKQGLNAYMFYTKENRARVKKENPNASPTEITTLLSQEWNAIKKGDDGEVQDKKAKKYYKLAEEDKKRYEEEMKDYTPPEGSDEEKKEKKKRSPTAYDLFCKAKRSEVKKEVDEDEELASESAGKRFGEVSKRLGAMWKKIKETSEGKKYETKAKELKESASDSESEEKSKKKGGKKKSDKGKKKGKKVSNKDESDDEVSPAEDDEE